MIDLDDLYDVPWCGVHTCDDPTCDRDVAFDTRRELRHVETVRVVSGL